MLTLFSESTLQFATKYDIITKDNIEIGEHMFGFGKKKAPVETTTLYFYTQGKERPLRNVPLDKVSDVMDYMQKFEDMSEQAVATATDAGYGHLVGVENGKIPPRSAMTALYYAGDLNVNVYNSIVKMQRYHDFFIHAEDYTVPKHIMDELEYDAGAVRNISRYLGGPR